MVWFISVIWLSCSIVIYCCALGALTRYDPLGHHIGPILLLACFGPAAYIVLIVTQEFPDKETFKYWRILPLSKRERKTLEVIKALNDERTIGNSCGPS